MLSTPVEIVSLIPNELTAPTRFCRRRLALFVILATSTSQQRLRLYSTSFVKPSAAGGLPSSRTAGLTFDHFLKIRNFVF